MSFRKKTLINKKFQLIPSARNICSMQVPVPINKLYATLKIRNTRNLTLLKKYTSAIN